MSDIKQLFALKTGQDDQVATECKLGIRHVFISLLISKFVSIFLVHNLLTHTGKLKKQMGGLCFEFWMCPETISSICKAFKKCTSKRIRKKYQIKKDNQRKSCYQTN